MPDSDAAPPERDGEALRASEERVRLLLESTGEGIYGIDRQGRCTFANRACAGLLGYADAAELLGRDMHALVHHRRADGSPYPEAECPIYLSTRQGKGTQVEDEVFWRRDGSSFPVEYRSYPVVREGHRIGAVVTFSDVTRRRQTQDQLRREEQRYRSLIEATSAIVWTMPPSGEFEVDQPGWRAFTGQSFEEMRGWGWLHAVHPDDRQATAQAWTAAVESRTAFRLVHRLRRHDGEYRDMASRAVPLPATDGTVEEWVGVHSDVTERERHQASLRQSEAWFRELAEALPQIVWVARADGSHEYFNQRWFDFTGLSAEEGIGRAWSIPLHPDDRERSEQRWREAIATGEPYEVEYRFRGRDGEYRWFLGRALPVRDDSGRVVRWFGTCTDVDEQKQAEAELRESQEQFRMLANSIPQLSWMARPDGSIFWFNRRWYDYTGTAPGDMEGWGWQSVLDPELLPEITERYKGALAGGLLWEDTFPLRRHDGAMRWHLSRAVPLHDGRGRVVRWFGTNTDVHDTKQAEEEVRRAKEEAEQANQAKSLFLANMSHELRTPLNAILMYSELLMEEAEDAGVQDSLPDLEKIQAAGKHLLGLINNVLDLSKVEAGKMDLSPEPFEVRAMLDEVVSTIEPLAQKNDNRLELRLAPDLGSMVADLIKVRQCLFNLLSNACKFAQGGVITLEARREPRGGADSITFGVADTGIGMTAEQVSNLFRPFSQADASTTRKYGGTGLGLAITRRLAELMGGEISVASEPGKGTTFTLRLPAALRPAPSAGPAHRRKQPAPGAESAGTVLVIDDDPAVADMMVRFLSREGYRAVTAGDGEEGLRRAREVRPDVITLDVMMPRMDGWAVLRALKADPELATVPVIMLTILDERNLGYLLGATEYMTKPIDRDRLGALLNKYRPARAAGPVLLVEDDEAMRRMLHGVLTQQGWSVAEAANGRVALDWLERQWREEKRPALIVLDLLMPEVDGFEVIAGLRRRPQWRSIPVVVLTSKDLTEEERERLNGGVQQVLQKGPSSAEETLEEVRRLLDSYTRKAAPPRTGS